MVLLLSLNLFHPNEADGVKDSHRTQPEATEPRVPLPIPLWSCCPVHLAPTAGSPSLVCVGLGCLGHAQHLLSFGRDWPNPWHPPPRGIPSLTFVIIPVQSSFMFFPPPPTPSFRGARLLRSLQCIKDVSEIDDWDVSGLYDDE